MTGKADFTEEEWGLVREGPPAAGMVALTAEKGGTFRESWALAKSYTEARKEHGESELLDAIASAKPQLDRHRLGSGPELKERTFAVLREVRDSAPSISPAISGSRPTRAPIKRTRTLCRCSFSMSARQ